MGSVPIRNDASSGNSPSNYLSDAERTYISRRLYSTFRKLLGIALIFCACGLLVTILGMDAFTEGSTVNGLRILVFGLPALSGGSLFLYFALQRVPETESDLAVGTLAGPYRWFQRDDNRYYRPTHMIGGKEVVIPALWTQFLRNGQPLRARIVFPANGGRVHVLSLDNGMSVETDVEAGLLWTGEFWFNVKVVSAVGSVSGLFALPFAFLANDPVFIGVALAVALPSLAVLALLVHNSRKMRRRVKQVYQSDLGIPFIPKPDHRDEVVHVNADEKEYICQQDNRGGIQIDRIV